MDTYEDDHLISLAASQCSPSSSPTYTSNLYGSFSSSPHLSSSPLRQSNGSFRKVSLFSSQGNRGSASDSEDNFTSRPTSGFLKQSLVQQQQQLDEQRALGGGPGPAWRTGRRGSLDDSVRTHRKVARKVRFSINDDDAEAERQDQGRPQLADFKLQSMSSSDSFASSSCAASPEAISSRSHAEVNTAAPVSTSSSSSSSSSSSTTKASDIHADIKQALKPPAFSLVRDPSRRRRATPTPPCPVTSSSSSSSSPASSSSSSSSPSSLYSSSTSTTVPFESVCLDEMETHKKKKKPHKRNFVAFVNTKSGAQKGEEALELLTDVLGEDRVFDLIELDDLEDCLEQFRDEKDLCIVVGGGDGTYSSILNTLIKMKFQPMPLLATLPMGTGNDLAREFGWGGGFEPDEEGMHEMFDLYQEAEPSPLDIWRVEIRPQSHATGEFSDKERRVQYMFNYFNIGFDADVSLGFDKSRKKLPWLFRAQFLNKLFYLCSVPRPIINGMPELHSCVMAEVDDDPITLPKDLRTLVVLNFTCYQAGLDIWGSATEAESAAGYPILWNTPSMSDRTVEVVGLGGLDHEAAVRTNMAKGYRLGQGSSIKIRLLDDVAINIDGEPEWQKAPCEVTLTRWGSISLLRRPEENEEDKKKKKKEKETKKKASTKVHIGSKRIAKRRRTAPAAASRAGRGKRWEQESKFSLGGFLLYMLTGRV